MRNVLFMALLVLARLPNLVQASEPKMITFFSDSCPACVAMRPAVDQLATDGYSVEFVNASQSRDVAAQYRVSLVPCFVLVKDGREVDRVVGQVPAGRLKSMFDRHRGPAKQPDAKQNVRGLRRERAVGHLSAVVRVVCDDESPGTGRKARSLGSGVLVRWNARIVVLTARHVVKSAKRIRIQFHTGRAVEAKLLKSDSTWDCAVLAPGNDLDGVEPVELEWGDAAMQQDGAILESCGYGPDGTLMANTGRFLGYRKAASVHGGPDDWMVIAGSARGGDSGGPVFNERGRVVGVLWGTNGSEVVCVQSGRVHATIFSAFMQRALDENCPLVPLVPVAMSIERHPTPAPECPCLPQDSPVVTAAAIQEQYLLQFRNDMAQSQRALEGQIQGVQSQTQALQGQVSDLAEAIRAQQAAPQVPVAPPVVVPPAVPPTPPVVEEAPDGGPRTAAGRISQRGADWLADHGGPISSRIAEGASEKLDSDSPGVRFVGWTQAKGAWAVFLAAIVLAVFLVVFLLHRLNSRLLPILAVKAAATANPLDDRAVAFLQRAHDRVGGIGDRVKARFSHEQPEAVPAETIPVTA